MKLHTNLSHYTDVTAALRRAKDAGHVDQGVYFEVLEYAGSRSHPGAFEVKLGWYGEKVKGDGRRWTNTGNRGAGTGNYAATWDEWGWFIAELFRADPGAAFGHYKTEAMFHEMTKNKFKESVTT